MKNKKGFTLVELITVIALLGIIMLLIVPNVVESFSNAKKNVFYDDLLNLYTAASSTYIVNAADDLNTPKIFCKSINGTGDNPLNVETSEKLYYRIQVDKTGQVIALAASNTEYSYSLEYNEDGYKKVDIRKNCDSEDDEDTNCIQEESMQIGCSEVTIPDSTPILP